MVSTTGIPLYMHPLLLLFLFGSAFAFAFGVGVGVGLDLMILYSRCLVSPVSILSSLPWD